MAFDNDPPHARLSRSGRSAGSGKLDRRLDIPVTEELEEALIAMATLNGMPKAEYARWLLERMVFGELNVVRKMTRLGPSGPSDEYPKRDIEGRR